MIYTTDRPDCSIGLGEARVEQRGSWEALSTAQEFCKDVSVHSSCRSNRFPLGERDGLKDLRSARKRVPEKQTGFSMKMSRKP